MKRLLKLSAVICILLVCGIAVAHADRTVPTSLSEQSASCVSCHEADMQALVNERRHSRHFGADVGC